MLIECESGKTEMDMAQTRARTSTIHMEKQLEAKPKNLSLYAIK